MSPNQILPDVYEIPPFDASSSVCTGSPTLLNPDTSDVRSSLGSSPCVPTVKFAPLPQVDPTRKRSLAPLGVSARSRRKRAVQQEARASLWSTHLDVPEENMEDPLITFAKFVKKTGRTLWRRVRKGSRAVIPEENESHPAEPVLDIGPSVDVMAFGGRGGRLPRVAVGGRRASWSSSDERRSLSLAETGRRKSDLARHSETW